MPAIRLEVVETSATNEIATAPSLGEGTWKRLWDPAIWENLGTTVLSTDSTGRTAAKTLGSDKIGLYSSSLALLDEEPGESGIS